MKNNRVFSINLNRVNQGIMPRCKAFFYAVAILLLASFSPGYSATQALMTNQLITLDIAHHAPTRMEMAQQKIGDVFFYPEESAKVVLHQSGMVFVVPNAEKPHVYITLMGENGTTQDLKLVFSDKNPQPLQFVDPVDQPTTVIQTTKEEQDKHHENPDK